MSYQNSVLWKNYLLCEEDKTVSEHTQQLAHFYDRIREQVKVLVGEISQDLPDYTVHDITHLDALWDIGGMFVGSNYPLNPLETFILGASFLLHDAGMSVAAYPGRMSEIRETDEWKKIFNKISAIGETEDVEKDTLEVFIRDNHAYHAAQLVKSQWESASGTRYLIEDGEIRQKLGKFIGDISASHWWSLEKIEQELDRQIPPPPPYPNTWKIDLLKLACILRVTDASHIDERRAPGFLFSLRSRSINEYSKLHWTFQNRLTQPDVRDHALHYASTSDFTRDEATAWWLAYDTLKMINSELGTADSLLLSKRGADYRLLASQVANISSPKSLTNSISVSGWSPIDTSFRISDIPRLVKNLGGEQLYGDDAKAPIREMIQNAMDACRLRQIVDSEFTNPRVSVSLHQEQENITLTVSDNGIGMSQSDITGKLLSFGESGWLKDSKIGEYNSNFPKKDQISGKFGIGFFSIFMISEVITVITRRFDESPDETNNLLFENGLHQRPIIFYSSGNERQLHPGTTVRIELLNSKIIESIKTRWIDDDTPVEKAIILCLKKMFPLSEIQMELDILGEKEVHGGYDWKTASAQTIVENSSELQAIPEFYRQFYENVRNIYNKDGELIGRAALAPRVISHNLHDIPNGVLINKGTKVSPMELLGVMLCSVSKASRDTGLPLCDEKGISEWATEQAKLIEVLNLSPEEQIDASAKIYALGGETGDLKICLSHKSFMSKTEFINSLKDSNEVILTYYHNHRRKQNLLPNVFAFESSISVIFNTGFLIGRPLQLHHTVKKTNMLDLARDLVCKELEIDDEVKKKFKLIKNGSRVYHAEKEVMILENGYKETSICEHYWRNMSPSDIEKYRK
ncbi:ATP-binding protein [Thalassospira povalilytica]|uniref:HD domain-containing protein n=1 Tax=Thalassospira povalilytica TaxID=732237 RepID=UPI003AA8E40C